MKFITHFTLLSLLPFLCIGEVSNKELGQKIDLVLQKIDGLEERVTKLEKHGVEVKNKIDKVSKVARTEKLDSSITIPQSEEEKKSFFSNLRLQLQSNEVKSRGAWTKKETWELVKKNLSEFKIRKLLGNPSSIKNSLNPRIGRVYYYRGDLNADGKEEIGQVNFFRERVVSFTNPFQ